MGKLEGQREEGNKVIITSKYKRNFNKSSHNEYLILGMVCYLSIKYYTHTIHTHTCTQYYLSCIDTVLLKSIET